MSDFLQYLMLGTSVLLILLILLQTRGASLGAGLGGGGEGGGGTVRRGSEKTIHQITIILVVIFASALVAGFFV